MLVRSCGLARDLPVFKQAYLARLSDRFNEKLFVDMAIQHKAAATAYAGLKRLDLTLDSEDAVRLKKHAIQNRLLRELMFEDACAIMQAMGKYDIPALVLKGPASSIELYGGAFVREFDDIDILVNLPDVEPVIFAMAELGYKTENYHRIKNADLSSNRLIQRSHHVSFSREDRPFRVEIHDRTGWESELFKRDDIDSVFGNSATLEESGNLIEAPTLANHAVLIITHGVKHAWCLLHWVLDAAALLNRDDPSLHRNVAARMRSLGMKRQLKLTCDLVKRLYPIELPPAIEATIFNEPELDGSVDFALEQLQTGGRYIRSPKNARIFRMKYSLSLLPRVKDKAASIFSPFKIHQIDIETLPLPRQLFFVHFLVRPFFVISRRLKRRREKRASFHA